MTQSESILNTQSTASSIIKFPWLLISTVNFCFCSSLLIVPLAFLLSGNSHPFATCSSCFFITPGHSWLRDPTIDKELIAEKERQEIELQAQQLTLQEQRNHIDILDAALMNAQNNVVRLETEVISHLI